MSDREEQLRQRAYGIWQSEGEPHGRDREHWDRAERELIDAPQETAPETIAAEPATPKKAASPRRKKAEAAPQTIAAESKEAKPLAAKARKPRSAKTT